MSLPDREIALRFLCERVKMRLDWLSECDDDKSKLADMMALVEASGALAEFALTYIIPKEPTP